MEPLQGGTILSSTHDTTLTKIDSNIGHDRSVWNSDGLSTSDEEINTLATIILFIKILGTITRS
jgi:hypothetical protein